MGVNGQAHASHTEGPRGCPTPNARGTDTHGTRLLFWPHTSAAETTQTSASRPQTMATTAATPVPSAPSSRPPLRPSSPVGAPPTPHPGRAA